MAEAIIIKASTGDPIIIDVGNQKIQGRVVSKTVQFGLFTMNENAVWASKNQLRKESYPFATINLKVNRFAFKYEVGDCFRFSCLKYGISDMVLRVLRRIETELESEEINVIAMEDLFQITNTIGEYSASTSYTPPRVDYTVNPITNKQIIESLYLWTAGKLAISPLAARSELTDLGFQTYLSLDLGTSYQPNPIGQPSNFRAYGTLVGDYPGPDDPTTNPHGTYEIDEQIGFIVDFSNSDVDLIESQEWETILSGSNNLAIIVSDPTSFEVISFKTITPVSGTQYKIEGVIRGRYGTKKVSHYDGEEFYFLGQDIPVIEDNNIIAGADLFFKLIGFNGVQYGSLSDAEGLELLIGGRAKTPYVPINFRANGKAKNAHYDADIALTWSPRIRGMGAGIGVPGLDVPAARREGLFEIEVWVGGALKRTTTDLDCSVWTYTEAMNIVDNGSPASIIIFKLMNFGRYEDGIKYSSDQVTVVCKKN